MIRPAGTDLGWDAGEDGVWWGILGYDSVGADRRAVTDCDWTQYLGSRADHYAIADGGVALALDELRTSEGYAVVEHDVIANLGCLTDDDAHAVVNEEAPADRGAGVNLDPRETTGDLAEDTRYALVARFHSLFATRWDQMACIPNRQWHFLRRHGQLGRVVGHCGGLPGCVLGCSRCGVSFR